MAAQENCCLRCGAPIPVDAPEGLCPRCLMQVARDEGAKATVETPPRIDGPGTTIGRYELLELIGEGGMGLVYLAEQKEPVRRKVALKIIKPGMDSKQVIARFEAERQALAVLDHPNIAHVFDAGCTDTGRPYFVMEHVKGMSITRYCDQNRLTIEQRLRLFEQVCEAVHHAHQKGIIHRDLKPSNILVSVHGDKAVPKIIDFGIAKAITQPLTDKTSVTLQGQLLGTPEYMSPEQVDLATQDIDTRSDIYSLGIVLYELLAGVLPFESESFARAGLAEIQQTIREQEPASPSIRLTNLGEQAKTIAASRGTQVVPLARRLHRELEWIPLKAMRKDRCRRYRSASEMADDVRNYLTGLPLIAGPETTIYRVQKFVRKHAGSVATVALVAVAIILGLVISTAMYLRAEDARQEEATARAQAEQAAKKEAGARADAEQARGKETVARTQAEQAEQATREKAEELRRTLYVNSIQLADAEYREGDIGRVRELLNACPNDLRGWEWNRLNHIADQSIVTLRFDPGTIYPTALSPDGSRLVKLTSINDGTLRILDLATGMEIAVLREHNGIGGATAFSPDGRLFASGGVDKTIKIWSIAGGTEIMTLPAHDGVIHVEFGPNSKRIISVSTEGVIKTWDVESGVELLTIHGNRYPVKASFSPDGRHIASGGERSVRIWDSRSGTETMAISAADEVWGVTYSPDGRRIASWGGLGRQIQIWDASTGAQVLTFTTDHRENVNSVAFSPDGDRLVSTGIDPVIKVWDAHTGRQLKSLCGHEGTAAMHAAFTPNGRQIVSCGQDGTIRAWSTILEVERVSLHGYEGLVSSVAFSPDGERIAASSPDALTVWDVGTRIEITTLRGREQGAGPIAFSPDGKRIVSADAPKAIRVWDVGSARQLLSLQGHKDWVYAVTFSPDGKYIVSGGEDKTVKVWDALTGREVMTCRGHTGSVYSVSVSSDGERVVSGGCQDAEGNSDGTVKVWDIKSGAELWSSKHGWAVFSVAFSPDNKYVASGGSDSPFDRTIKLWDAKSGVELMTLSGHDRGIGSVAFSPDGKRILSGSKDETLKLWDLATGAPVMTIPARGAVWSAVFSPDGKTIAIGDGNMVTLFESSAPAAGYQARIDGEAATRTVDDIYRRCASYHEVIRTLWDDNTLGEAVRKLALQIANSREWEDADKLAGEAWENVKSPGKGAETYMTAVEKAEKANGWEPNDPTIVRVLGAAQYRTGSYNEALKTLKRGEQIRVRRGDEPDPAALPFAAMTLHQLGRGEEAKAALEQLRALLKDERFADDPEAKALLAEAEGLLSDVKK